MTLIPPAIELKGLPCMSVEEVYRCGRGVRANGVECRVVESVKQLMKVVWACGEDEEWWT